MHYGFGIAVGAVYGALAETRPELTRLGGVPFGLGCGRALTRLPSRL